MKIKVLFAFQQILCRITTFPTTQEKYKHILLQNALYETLFPSLYFVRCVVCRERSPVGCSSAGGRLDWSIFIVARNNCPATYKQIIPNPAAQTPHNTEQKTK